MTPEVFSEAMNHLSDRYLLEALELQAPRRLRPRRRAAACLCAACLAAALLLGTALAVSTSFRQAVFTFLFPRYDQHQLHEIEAGHQTGSFDLQDTLFSFLQTLNDEDLLNRKRAWLRIHPSAAGGGSGPCHRRAQHTGRPADGHPPTEALWGHIRSVAGELLPAD